MNVHGFHHIGLPVKDLEKSLDFYTKGLGGKVTGSFPFGDSGKSAYFVDLGGNSTVELLPMGTGAEEKDAHWAHIALNSKDAKADHAQAVKAGAAVRSEPKEVQLGPMKVVNSFVLGPDREVIEIFQAM